MPRKYAKRPKRKRNYTRRYKRNYPRRSLVSRGVPSGMPTTRIANLRYADTTSLACTSGVLNEYIFRANSIFDPDQTATGHQPMGHDQWANLFNHYAVLGAKMSIRIINDTTPAQAICGTYLSDGKTLSYTLADEYIEARKGSYRLIQPNNPKTLSLTNKFSAKKFFNVKDMKDNFDRLGASMGANAGDSAFFHLWYQTLDGSSDTIRFSVVIDYIVLFSEPKDLSQS